MDAGASLTRTKRGHGRIVAGQFEAATAYELHLDGSDRVQLVRFDEHPDDLPDGTVIHLTLEDGRALACQILGDSPFCAIVGDGPIRHTRSGVTVGR
jgi:hypothetical protein